MIDMIFTVSGDVPDFGSIIKFGKWYGLVQYTDYDKMESKLKLYKTFEEADNVVHDVSLRQHPEWHKTECRKCRVKE